jgi:hypothetical protein
MPTILQLPEGMFATKMIGLGRQGVYRRDWPVNGVDLGGYRWFCD